MIQTPQGLIIIGDPVAHSLSPRMHAAALKKAGLQHLDYTARQVRAEELDSIVAEIRERKLAGNVTIPHKQNMYQLCDSTSELARKVGAINTFWMQGDILCGDNTDVAGFDFAAKRLVGESPKGLKIALIGAGGAASAVAVAIQSWDDCSLTVWNRSEDRLHEFMEEFDYVSGVSLIEEAVKDANLVINATPIGLKDNTHPVGLDLLPSDAAVLDLVYKPDETAWVKDARLSGRKAEDGIHMLIEQGAVAFKRWFGIEPDRGAMWNALKGSAS